MVEWTLLAVHSSMLAIVVPIGQERPDGEAPGVVGFRQRRPWPLLLPFSQAPPALYPILTYPRSDLKRTHKLTVTYVPQIPRFPVYPLVSLLTSPSRSGSLRNMSKRSLASSASPARRSKKAKVSTGVSQSRLDSFFSTPKCREPSADTLSQTSGAVASPKSAAQNRGREKGKKADRPLTDEELAWSLASADGLDLETLKKLESDRTNDVHLSGATNNESTNPEVIDVDALGETILQNAAGPSFHATPVESAVPGVVPSPSTGKPPLSATQQTIGNSDPSKYPTYYPLDVDPPSYTPTCEVWAPNAPVPYSFLAHTLATLSGTRSRIAKLDTLTNALRSICQQHPPSLLPALYLFSNSLSPPYSPLELGLGPSIISKAIQHVSGLSSAALKRLYNATGDPGKPGIVAKSSPPLTQSSCRGRSVRS